MSLRLIAGSATDVGRVRTGNEDAYAVIHVCESRQEDLGEAALVLLCDGMGGYEAGEVAAAISIQVMRPSTRRKPTGPPRRTTMVGGDATRKCTWRAPAWRI